MKTLVLALKHYIAKVLVLALLYILTGKLGLLLAVPPGYATIIWPPSGIALGMLIIFGWQLWPGVLIGSFLLNCHISGAYSAAEGLITAKSLVALGIAIGSTLQALAGHALISRLIGIPLKFNHIRGVVWLFILSGPLACLIAASIGVSTLYFSGAVPSESVLNNWLAWWAGDMFGITVFLPLILLSARNQNQLLWRNNTVSRLPTLAMLVLIMPLGLSFYAWKIASVNTYEKNQAEFESLAIESEKVLLNRLDSYKNALLGGAGLLYSSTFVSHQEWQNYVETIEIKKNFPGLSGLGWIKSVKPEEKNTYLQEIYKNGTLDFTIHPETQNKPYYVVTYIEPKQDNKSAQGLNIAFENNRLEAANNARDSGSTAITKRVVLVQDEQRTPSLLLLHPIYHQGKPTTTPEERRAALQGWIYAPIIANKFLNDLTNSQGYKLNLRIYDDGIESPDTLLYNSSADAHSAKPGFTLRKSFMVFQQKWLVVWESTPAYEQTVRSVNPLFILVGGLLFTGMCSMLLLAITVQRMETVEWIAGKRIAAFPIMIFVAIAAGSYALYAMLQARELSYIKSHLWDDANGIELLLNTETRERLLALKRMGQRWEVAGGTPLKLWQSDASNHIQQLDGLRTVEWVDSTYHVRWAEPLKGNEKAIGLNIIFDKERAQSIKGAAEKHIPTLTPPLNLVQGYTAFIAYVPLYIENKFDGFIVGIFSIHDFFSGVITNELTNNYSLSISYNEKPYFTNATQPVLKYKELGIEKNIQIYDKLWTFRIVPTQLFVESQQTILPNIVLFAGLLIAGLSALSTRYILISRLKSGWLELSNQKIKEEISERVATSKALQESNTLKSAVLSSTRHLVVATNTEGIITVFNDAAEKALGYKAEEVVGKHTPAIWHDMDEIIQRAQALTNELGINIAPGSSVFTTKVDLVGVDENEWTFIRKDKTRFPGYLTATSLKNTNQDITGYLGVIEDITVRKELINSLEQSEERYELAVQGMSVGLWDWNVNTNELFWSQKFKDLIGLDDQNFIPHYNEFADRLHPEDKEYTLKMLSDHLARRSPYNVEYRLRHQDGHYVWIHAFGQAKWDANNNPIRMAGSVNDITEQKQQQEALKSSEETFRSAMEHASIGMALVAPNGHWLKVNHALCEMLGYSQEELLANDFQSITYPGDLAQDLEYVRQMLANEIKTYQMEKRYYHKMGQIIWTHLSVSLVRHANGAPNYFISQIQDITERREMDRIKGEFISMVSHELRTPLTSIRGSLGLILGAFSKDLSANVMKMITIAYNNCERLVLIINDILDIDKMAAGQMSFDMQDENVEQLLQQALEANRVYGEKFNVRFELTSVDPDYTINVDATRMMQALSNLLSNAIKFSLDGQQVDISSSRIGDAIQIAIKDYGPGIPEEFRTRIFGKFSQADSSATRKKGGTGLGLHITKQMVEHMGGEIGFETEVGQGTTFWIRFPEIKRTPETSNVDDTFPTYQSNSRVLVCEDNQDIATLMKMMLEHANIRVDIARTLPQARILLATNTYVAMTLDLLLPHGNGLEFIHELRENPQTQDLPIIVVSAKADEGKQSLKEEAMGVIDWLAKPIDESRLISALKHAIKAQRSSSLPRILHVEDDIDLSRLLATLLHDKAELINAQTLREAETLLRKEEFSLIILDLSLPDGSGNNLLERLPKITDKTIPVLILSASEATPDIKQRVVASLVKSRMPESKLVDLIMHFIEQQDSKNQG